ncbi:unnamed protein product [Polarella glacialis]|uniref:Uncharacterized protein n=1 Tax=Polarella glacialis TaxID=89957 RepID=A0A813HXT7_POLGL|nr:unnamed protein product [Polarella glacialis]
MMEFSAAGEAVQWVEDCQQKVGEPADGSIELSLATFAASHLATPALAMFCWANASEQPFSKCNIFAAGIYAHKVVSLPFCIASMQQQQQKNGVHPRRLASGPSLMNLVRGVLRSLLQLPRSPKRNAIRVLSLAEKHTSVKMLRTGSGLHMATEAVTLLLSEVVTVARKMLNSMLGALLVHSLLGKMLQTCHIYPWI